MSTPLPPTAHRVGETLRQGGRTYSFEFFPPKTDEGEQQLWQALAELEPLKPTFASVTYGAGGSTRDRTVRITAQMAARTSLVPVAHLTCVGSTITELEEILAEYAAAGVSSVLALRGDPAAGPGTPWVSTPGGIDHADQLVELIRQTGDFGIGVAAFPDGHPESSTRDQDAQVLARKQDAGAEFAITQFFFRASDYFDLVERAAAHGCDMPIIPGLMPVTNVAQIQRFAALSGAAFPADLAAQFEAIAEDAEAVQQLGVEVATDLAAELLAQGAPGLHFYTLNRSSATRQVYEALTLRNV